MADSVNFDFGSTTDATPVADAAPVEAAPAKTSNKEEAKLIAAGNEILKGINPEVKENFGKGSHDVVFLYMLGNPLVKAKRRVRTLKDANGNTVKNENGAVVGEDVDCSSPIGFAFKAIKPVSIPQINVKKRDKFGKADVKPDKQVAAGEIFVLTYPELYVFATRPEYSAKFDCAYLDASGNVDVNKVIENGVRVKLGLTKYSKAIQENGANATEIPFPVPQVAYNFEGAGAPKAGMKDICLNTKDANGMPQFTDPLYAEKFTEYFKRERTASPAGAKSKPNKSNDMVALCVACQDMLKNMLAE